MLFKVGDVVEGRFGGRDKWYSGKIEAVHATKGTYDIRYDDGDRETGVVEKLIRQKEGMHVSLCTFNTPILFPAILTRFHICI